MEIEPIEEIQEESKTTRFIKRFFTILIAIFLILIIVVYIIPGPTLLSIVEGKLVSNKLDKYLSITLKDNTKITFNKETYNELLEVYNNNQINEFKICLHGTLNENNYYLNKIEYPIIYSQTVFSVNAQQCSKDTLVSLHSHPENHCIHSWQDSISHKKFKEINPNALSAVMCTKNRFHFFR